MTTKEKVAVLCGFEKKDSEFVSGVSVWWKNGKRYLQLPDFGQPEWEGYLLDALRKWAKENIKRRGYCAYEDSTWIINGSHVPSDVTEQTTYKALCAAIEAGIVEVTG